MGVYCGVCFSCVAVVPVLLRWMVPAADVKPLPPFWLMVVVYITAGGVAGTLFGTMLPLLRWWVGRRVVSILAAVPFAFAMAASMDGVASARADARSILTFAAIYGFALSFALEGIFPEFRPRLRRHRSRW